MPSLSLSTYQRMFILSRVILSQTGLQPVSPLVPHPREPGVLVREWVWWMSHSRLQAGLGLGLLLAQQIMLSLVAMLR